MNIIRCVRRLIPILLIAMTTSCGSLPSLSYTPVDAQLGKENTQNTVAKQTVTQGDSQTNYFTPSSSMIAAFFAGGALSLLSSLGFIYIIIKRDKQRGKNGQTGTGT